MRARRASPLRGDRLLQLGAPLACGRERVHARAVRNAACAASVLAVSPPHVSSADACSARPYENESGHGPPTWLIALRFSVASTSDCPPERKTMPGNGRGNVRRKHRSVSSAIRAAGACSGAALARDHHVRLEQRRRGDRRAGTSSSWNVHLQRARRHLVAALDRVVGVHQHLGLDDRDDPGLLAQRGVARERVRVRADAVRREGMPSPIVITARHLAKRAPSAWYSSSRSRSPSRPSVIVLARGAGERRARPCRP